MQKETLCALKGGEVELAKSFLPLGMWATLTHKPTGLTLVWPGSVRREVIQCSELWGYKSDWQPWKISMVQILPLPPPHKPGPIPSYECDITDCGIGKTCSLARWYRASLPSRDHRQPSPRGHGFC